MTRALNLLIALTVAASLAGCGATVGPSDSGEGGPVGGPAQPIQLSSGDATAWFELLNTADESLDWIIEVEQAPDNPESGAWFDVEPREGRLEPGGRQLVGLVQHEGLTPGTYHSFLTVIYRGGETRFEATGEVAADGSYEDGSGSISGRLFTANSLIPIRSPQFAASSLSAAERSVGETEQAEPQFVPGQLIVALDARDDERAVFYRLGQRHGLDVIRQLGNETGTRTALVSLPPGEDEEAAAARLEREPNVRYAEPNYLFRLHSLPNDPYLAEAWQLPVIGAPLAWQASTELDTLPITAVIDSGIDLDHEDLRGIFVSSGFDFCATSDCTEIDSDPRPDSSADTHGTHVTGLLAALANNGRGLAGVVPSGARILPVKVFNDGGQTTALAVAEAIRWAAGENTASGTNRNPARIITLSLGSGQDSTPVREAIEAAQARGVLVIASSGNQGENGVDYPARYEGVLGVGAVNTDFRRSCFSDYGRGLDLMAPGGDGYQCTAPRDEAILSTFPASGYGFDAGTSMAAPLVAGAAALVWADLSSPDAARVRDRLLDTAYYDGDYMSPDRYGAGVVRVDAALGLPAPGASATVQATGPSTDLDQVILDREGGSSGFLLENLAGGRYDVRSEVVGRQRTLTGSQVVDLREGERVSSLTIQLER